MDVIGIPGWSLSTVFTTVAGSRETRPARPPGSPRERRRVMLPRRRMTQDAMGPNSTTPDRTVDPDSLLVRGLGVRQLTATIFNHTVGSGIFVLPAFAVANLGGAAPLAYLACALVMVLVVLVFAEAGSRVTATGGPYAYVEIGLGPLFGFATGILLAASQVAAAGAISMLLAQSLARLAGLEGVLWPG